MYEGKRGKKNKRRGVKRSCSYCMRDGRDVIHVRSGRAIKAYPERASCKGGGLQGGG